MMTNISEGTKAVRRYQRKRRALTYATREWTSAEFARIGSAILRLVDERPDMRIKPLLLGVVLNV